jgi:cytochrome c-type biogenesis protein CcmF
VVADVYLTLVDASAADGRATIRVVIEPLVSWLWIGGAVIALGTILALFPGRARRRPTAPVSSPIAGSTGSDDDRDGAAGPDGGGSTADPSSREPVVTG